MKPEEYPANWEQSGRGLGLQPPSQDPFPEPARGQPEVSPIEPDTGGLPPTALGPQNQPQSPISPPPDTVTAQYVEVSGGSTFTATANFVIVP